MICIFSVVCKEILSSWKHIIEFLLLLKHNIDHNKISKWYKTFKSFFFKSRNVAMSTFYFSMIIPLSLCSFNIYYTVHNSTTFIQFIWISWLFYFLERVEQMGSIFSEFRTCLSIVLFVCRIYHEFLVTSFAEHSNPAYILSLSYSGIS